MSQNTTEKRAARDAALSRNSRPATSGNKNVRATRTPEPMGNGTLGAALGLVRRIVKGPFLGTNRPS